MRLYNFHWPFFKFPDSFFNTSNLLVAERILQGTLRDGEMITVDAQGEGPLGEFLFESRPFDAAAETGAGAPATAEPAALEPTAAGDAGDAGLTKAE